MVADLRAEAVAAARRAPAELQAAAHALGEDAGADDRYAAALAGAERLDAWGADRCLNAALEEFGAAYAPATALRELSVGRRYRLRLACALAEPAGTILLDEPSSHLDDATLDRLAERLLAHEGITVFVTHDRWLLDAVATALLDLDPAVDRGGTLFRGTYGEYRRARSERLGAWRELHAASLAAGAELEQRMEAARTRTVGSRQPAAGQGRGEARPRRPVGRDHPAAATPAGRRPDRSRACATSAARVRPPARHGRRRAARGGPRAAARRPGDAAGRRPHPPVRRRSPARPRPQRRRGVLASGDAGRADAPGRRSARDPARRAGRPARSEGCPGPARHAARRA
jgi:ATPase subunit of ABC transporter with duplicated ATPase domains